MLSDKSEHSEVEEDHEHFWSVDKYGYITREHQKEKGFDKHISVDRLIMAGRKRVQKDKEIEEIEAEATALLDAGETLKYDDYGWPKVPKADRCSWRKEYWPGKRFEKPEQQVPSADWSTPDPASSWE